MTCQSACKATFWMGLPRSARNDSGVFYCSLQKVGLNQGFIKKAPIG